MHALLDGGAMKVTDLKPGHEIRVNGKWMKIQDIQEDKPHNLRWCWIKEGRYVRLSTMGEVETR